MPKNAYGNLEDAAARLAAFEAFCLKRSAGDCCASEAMILRKFKKLCVDSTLRLSDVDFNR